MTSDETGPHDSNAPAPAAAQGAGDCGAGNPGWDEAERLAALDRYRILDTPRELEFDDIVRLAADIFEAPIAVVNLIAEGRQWFKAEVGIGADELPLDVSICAHAILQPGIFVVPDTTKDERFAANPLVLGEPGLRFYAGALLETAEGLPLGTVCVLDTKPRPGGITARQRLTLEVLARQAMTQLELRRAIAERQRRAEQLETEIDTRREVGAALEDTTRRLDAVLNNTRMAVFLMDDRQQCVYANAAAEKLTGYRFGDMRGRALHDVVHHTKPDGSHYPLEECPIDRAFPERAQMSGTELFVAPDGSFYPVAFTASPVLDDTGVPIGTVIEARNIAEEQARDEALRENEARLRALTDNLPAGMVYQVATGVDGSDRRFLYVSGSHERLTGVPAEAVLADPSLPYQLIFPEDRPAMAAAEAEAIRDRKPFDVQTRFRRSDGELRWCRIISEPREQPDGSLVWDGLQIDTTDQKRAEDALRAKEERLRELNDTLEAQVAERTADRNRMWRLSTDIMLVARLDGTINSVNPAWTTLFDWNEADLVGETVLDFVHPDDVEATLAEMAKLEQGATTFRFENRYRARDGSYRWISWTAVPEADLLHAVGRDVTAEKERRAELEAAQDALRQAQKMEAIGQLTGGVAHDFNNLLTPIVGSLDMLVRRGLGSERERRLIDGALQSAERAKILVQRLLAFARRQPLQPQAVDLKRLVTGMADLISSTSGPAIEVRVDLPDDLPPATADANQVEMAVLNLAVNARDAMPDGGTLSISAARASVSAQDRSTLRPGHYVRLSVSDTGTGMDEATLARAIEPFFSTKGIGKGTGLGLSMVHGLALQLNGGLTIASRLGDGTSVDLWLPISATEADGGARPADVPPAREGRGRALLVDDEELVRMSTADMLVDLGYEVVEAVSAEDALRLIAEGLKPDLLVTDHLMPGMSGAELARELRSRRADLPVLIVSGFAEADGLDPGMARLTKPFRNAELAASLAALTPDGATRT
jgi:PAS domain S-box-containing protein